MDTNMVITTATSHLPLPQSTTIYRVAGAGTLAMTAIRVATRDLNGRGIFEDVTEVASYDCDDTEAAADVDLTDPFLVDLAWYLAGTAILALPTPRTVTVTVDDDDDDDDADDEAAGADYSTDLDD